MSAQRSLQHGPAPQCKDHVDTGKVQAVLQGYEADWRDDGNNKEGIMN